MSNLVRHSITKGGKMKKGLSMVLAGLLVTVFCFLASAQEQEETMDNKMMQGGQMGEGTMGRGQGMVKGKKMMGMGMMMNKEIVATEDGGVVVMIGNKLLKYDKNLDLKKEVEIKIDTAGMQERMMQMKENCPGHQREERGEE